MSDFNRDELKERKLEEFRPMNQEKPSPQPEFDEEEEASFFDRFKVVVPIILIAIVCFVAYAWYTDKFAISSSGGNIPLVKASTETLREKPEDPGGLKIVNRDKKVFDTISGKDNDDSVKSATILPAPEEPIERDKIASDEASAELIKKLPEQDKSAVTAEAVPQKPVTQPAVPEEIVTDRAAKSQPELAAKTEPAQAIAGNDTPKVQEKAVTAADIIDVAPKKKPTPQNKSAKTNLGYRVQLGSYRSSGDAEASWKTIKKKYSAVISSANDYIEKADLGDKGIFYRLQLAGFKSESEARKVCQKLTEHKQGCFFVGK